MVPPDEAVKTGPTRSPPTATPQQAPPGRAARRRFAQSGHAREQLGTGRGSLAPISSPGSGTASRTQPAPLDYLPFAREAAPFAEPAQALPDVVVLDLLGRATVVADHELALV